MQFLKRLSVTKSTRHRAPRYPATVLAVMLLLSPGLAVACTLPVFRYALERWVPSAYELYVIHDPKAGEVTDAQVASWTKSIGEDSNITQPARLIAVNDSLSEVDKSLVEELKLDKSVTLPRVVLARAVDEGTPRILWSAPFAEPLSPQLLDSPARRQIAKQLLAGDSSVWLLVAGEDAAANASARAALESELRKAEKELSLPEQAPPDEVEEVSRMRSSIPLKLAFSIVEIKRNDPAEASLLHMLDRCDEYHEVKKAKPSDPAVHAIFGRGRAMPGLHGATLVPANIRELCEFIIGPCSCQIKQLNPGLDLLMTVKWEDALFADAPTPLVTVPAAITPIVEQMLPTVVPTVVPAAVTPAADLTTPLAVAASEPARQLDQRKVIVLGGVILLTVLAGFMWRRAR